MRRHRRRRALSYTLLLLWLGSSSPRPLAITDEDMGSTVATDSTADTLTGAGIITTGDN